MKPIHRKHNFSGGPKRRFNVYIPVRLHHLLNSIAKHEHCSISYIISKYLTKATDDYTQQK